MLVDISDEQIQIDLAEKEKAKEKPIQQIGRLRHDNQHHQKQHECQH